MSVPYTAIFLGGFTMRIITISRVFGSGCRSYSVSFKMFLLISVAVVATFLSGCNSKNAANPKSISDEHQYEQISQQMNTDDGSKETQEYDVYSDTNYDVPDGYTRAIEGRQYGESNSICIG